MTIQIVGYVEKTDTNSAPPGHIAVMVRFGQGAATPTTFFVREEEAQHWLAGATVNLTAWPCRRKSAVT